MERQEVGKKIEIPVVEGRMVKRPKKDKSESMDMDKQFKQNTSSTSNVSISEPEAEEDEIIEVPVIGGRVSSKRQQINEEEPQDIGNFSEESSISLSSSSDSSPSSSSSGSPTWTPNHKNKFSTSTPKRDSSASTLKLNFSIDEADDNFFDNLEAQVKSMVDEGEVDNNENDLQTNHQQGKGNGRDVEIEAQPQPRQLPGPTEEGGASLSVNDEENVRRRIKVNFGGVKYSPVKAVEAVMAVQAVEAFEAAMTVEDRNKQVNPCTSDEVEIVEERRRSGRLADMGYVEFLGTGKGQEEEETLTALRRQNKKSKKQFDSFEDKKELANQIINVMKPYYRNKTIETQEEFRTLARRLSLKALRRPEVRGEEKVREYVVQKFEKALDMFPHFRPR